jgi:nucleotide-binding universal stress UspA family protein
MDEAGFAGKTILVGIDGSANARKAFAWAVAEARFRDAEVEAVYVFQVSGLAYGAPAYVPMNEADVEADARKALAEALADTPGADDVKVRLRATSGLTIDTLRHAAEDPGVGLVVVGAQGHGVVGRLLLGSVSLGLAHRCPKPLVIVPRDWSTDPFEIVASKIVVGIDGSEHSDRVLEWAVHEGAVRDAAVKAVMVWSTPHPVLPARVPLPAAVSAAGDSVIENPLQHVIDQVDPDGVHIEAVVLQGHPAEKLMDLAVPAQLLVVGRRGLGWAREKLLGSVSRACALHASVPVVIVPSCH